MSEEAVEGWLAAAAAIREEGSPSIVLMSRGFYVVAWLELRPETNAGEERHFYAEITPSALACSISPCSLAIDTFEEDGKGLELANLGHVQSRGNHTKSIVRLL